MGVVIVTIKMPNFYALSGQEELSGQEGRVAVWLCGCVAAW